MKIYLISQTVNTDYESYDSAVVIAKSKQKARMTHPNDGVKVWDGKENRWGEWCDASNVSVKLIGIAGEGSEAGVVCASFNSDY